MNKRPNPPSFVIQPLTSDERWGFAPTAVTHCQWPAQSPGQVTLMSAMISIVVLSDGRISDRVHGLHEPLSTGNFEQVTRFSCP
jgi:hypothetical protein